MIPQIHLLYSLVFLETGFIFYSYYGMIGLGTSFPAMFYFLMSLVDINSTSRKFTLLVLLTTIGISIPRILVKMDDVNEKKIEKELSLVKEIAPEYIPILQNCNDLVAWDMQGRNNCLQRNSEETKKANEIQIKNMEKKKSVVQNSVIGNREIAELILFVTISFCLPLGIFVLLIDHKTDLLDSIKSAKEKSQIITESSFEKKTYQENVNLIQISTNISSNVEVPIQLNTTKVEQEKENKENKVIVLQEQEKELNIFEGKKWVQNYVLSGFSYDYFLPDEKVLIDVIESKKIFELAKTVLQKKQIAIGTGYKYCVSTDESVSGISNFVDSKMGYSLIMQNSKSQETIIGLSAFLTAKEIHQFTHVPLATVYKRLNSA